MIDFEFEFQYAEEKAPALRNTAGSVPKCWGFAEAADAENPRCSGV